MRKSIKTFWQNLDILYKLLFVNVAVFVVITVIKLFSYLFGAYYITDFIVGLLAMPASALKLLFKPWTPLTYMFLHESFWHIFANMLWLYFMGIIFVMYFNQRLLWRVYLLSGLAGAALYFLAYNIFPAFAPFKTNSILLGASAAISGIVIAAATYKPNDNVYVFGILKVPLWIIGALYVLYDLASLPGGNAGGHLAHLGGAIFGFVFALEYKKSKDITAWLTNLNFKQSKRRTRRAKMKVTKNDYRPDDYQWNKQRKDIQEEIDRILEKIAKHGYNSLTKKEREFLRQHSRDYDGFYG